MLARRLLTCAVALSLAGCSAGARAYQPEDPLDTPTAYFVFDLADEYEVIDIRYAPADVPDSAYVRGRLSVQVFARRRDTGQEALLLYDLSRPQQGPTAVIEMRRPPRSAATQR